MAKDTLLLKPMEDNVDEYIKLLANFCSINENLLKIVYDYFKQETFLILSLFAEQKITFPSVKNMDIIKQKLKIYYIMKEKMKESKDSKNLCLGQPETPIQ